MNRLVNLELRLEEIARSEGVELWAVPEGFVAAGSRLVPVYGKDGSPLAQVIAAFRTGGSLRTLVINDTEDVADVEPRAYEAIRQLKEFNERQRSMFSEE